MANLAQKNTSSPRPAIFAPGYSWSYQYGHVVVSSSGDKNVYPCQYPIHNTRSRSHVSTGLKDRKGEKWIYGISLDQDVSLAHPKFLSRGKIDHRKCLAFIKERYPTVAKYLCTITRSTGGKGLGWILWFPPFPYHKDCANSVNYLAWKVHRVLRAVLNFHEMGFDEHHSGIGSYTPNWRNGNKRLHIDQEMINRVQNKKKRIDVLNEVYNELRCSEAFKEPTRKDFVEEGKRFAVKEEANEGLAKIYAHVICVEPEGLKIRTTYADLMEISGLTIPTLKKYIPRAPWASVAGFIRGEGFELKVIPIPELSEIAFSGVIAIGSGKSKPRPLLQKISSPTDWVLPEPEEVCDGARNNYLWRKAVILRNAGFTFDEALSLLRELASRIPGARRSRNCRKVKDILTSIFRHYPVRQFNNRKIFLLEGIGGYSHHNSNSPLPSHEVIKPIRPLPVKVPQEKTAEAKPHLLMVSRQPSEKKEEKTKSVNQGGPGDPPPAKLHLVPQDNDDRRKEGLAMLAELAPSLARTLSDNRKSGETAAVKTTVEPLSIKATERVRTAPREIYYGTLKEKRRANFKEVDPFERVWKAYDRCRTRKSDQQIFETLCAEEPHVEAVQRRCKGIYQAPKGPFKRILNAYGVIGRIDLRYEFLRIFRDFLKGPGKR